VFRTKAMEDPTARVGVLLLGTQKDASEVRRPGLYQLLAPTPPSAAVIRDMRGRADDPAALRALVGAEPVCAAPARPKAHDDGDDVLCAKDTVISPAPP
jgi:hypothetical protein